MGTQETNLQFPIPNSVLEPYIKQAVSAAIIGAIGDGTKLIEAAVHGAISQKVNINGQRSDYDPENKYQLVDIFARNKIAEIAREVINEMAEQMRPKIKAQIEKEIKTKHGVIAKTLTDGLIQSLSSTWAVKISMSDK